MAGEVGLLVQQELEEEGGAEVGGGPGSIREEAGAEEVGCRQLPVPG